MSAIDLVMPKRHVVVDFEFRPTDGIEGNPIEVICGVFKSVESGETVRVWKDDLYDLSEPPLPGRKNTVLVGFYTAAEMSCFKALGWVQSLPILDLYAEFRVLTNGIELTYGRSLVGALQFFGIATMGSAHKVAMRQLALRGGPYTQAEKQALMDYCNEDVEMTQQLFEAMAQYIDYPRALLRGRFSIPLAEMEGHGSPVDFATLGALQTHWEAIKAELVRQIDQDFGVYENGSFKEGLFEGYLAREEIRWPRHGSGRVKLDDDTFKEMSRIHPQIKPLRTLRDSLAKLRLSALAVGQDGRNRCLLSPFGASTGRNTPSSTRFIFGWPKWARGLIQPKPGFSIAYLDFGQQEFAIAAVLSGDPKMLEAYRSGDPYLAFAIQAGALSDGATKESHPSEREQFKQCILATQYGMFEAALAIRINQPVIRARQLLAQHRRVYRRFWEWSDDMFNGAVARNQVQTRYGWRLLLKADLNPRSVRNFPMQATGAEILRIACILVHEQGVQLCAPVHDALLIEAPDELIHEHAEITQKCMTRASEIVLGGFPLKSDIRILSYPDRFLDKDHQPFWDQVMNLMAQSKAKISESSDT